jgi:tetratricopeptide (TPR) repeat protein
VDRADEQPSGERPPEAPTERERLKRTIAVSLASLVVLGGGLAILQVDASAHESNTARETTRTAVQAMRANVLADTVAGLQPQLQSERDFLPYRRPLDASEPSLAGAVGLAPPRASTVAGSLRVAQQALPDLGVGTLLTGLQFDAERLTLKQRALATTRITWNDRSTQYTTVIAVLAVALFLVGFALVAEGQVRRAAYTLGIAVGLFAAVWAAWVYHLPIPSTPDSAIDAAARGNVETTNGNYRAAITQFDRAIAEDNEYAAAYSGRARARLLDANPDYAVTRGVVESGGPMVAAAVEDARKALALNGRDIVSATLLALTSFYDGDYEAAGSATDEALALNGKVPDLWLLRSAIEVARGDPVAAKASLEHALSLLQGAEPSQRTRLLAASYLSYLAWLERHDPAHAAAARRLADMVVAVETRYTLGGGPLPKAPPATGTATVRGLRFADGKLMARLVWRNLPDGTALSAIGYERTAPNGAWSQPADLALFATIGGSGSRAVSVPLERTCEPTSVRVDLYLNGAPTVSRTGPGVSPTC